MTLGEKRNRVQEAREKPEVKDTAPESGLGKTGHACRPPDVTIALNFDETVQWVLFPHRCITVALV